MAPTPDIFDYGANYNDEFGQEEPQHHHHFIHFNAYHISHHHNQYFPFVDLFHHSKNGTLSRSGEGTEKEGLSDSDYNVIIICSLIVPLLIALILILLVAAIVRRMRKSETTGNNVARSESYLQSNIVAAASGQSQEKIESCGDDISTKSEPTTTTLTFENGVKKQQVMKSCSTSAVHHSHSQSQLPPWFLIHSPTVFRSQYYNRNHLQQIYSIQMGKGQASKSLFPSFYSMSNIPTVHGSLMGAGGIRNANSVEDITTESSEDDLSGKSIKRSGEKSLSKIIKKLNISKKLKEKEAEKKRFNIYTLPDETREQLKHLYVY